MASALRAVVLLVAMADAGHAQTPAIETFLAQLQRASQAGDRAAVAAMVRHPIAISKINGQVGTCRICCRSPSARGCPSQQHIRARADATTGPL